MSSTLPIDLPVAARLLALRLLGVVFAVLVAGGSARAQPVEDAGVADPPGRVGSISLLAGPVTMVDLATGSREEALLNWPVTGGWRIETGGDGRAEVRIGSSALRLDEETTVDVVRLDDRFIQLAVLRGGASLRLRSREVLGELEVLTQRERMTFDDVGRYRIDVDRPDGLTAVTAFFGRVRIGVGRSTFVVGSGQRGELAASPPVSFEIVAAAADDFDQWVAAREAREESIRSAAYVSRETTGVELLDAYGDWRPVEDYGPVWFPRGVPATWAPYRFGRWVWFSPWGWTWVDDAPWGFAPLHYGRWVVVGGIWGWVPGVIVPRPVYAPALVGWFGAPGVTVTIGAPVGWFPLGPREIYVPPHRHSPRYLRVVNVQHVPNVAEVTIVQAPRYVHRHPDRSTWVPGDRFGRPEPVQRGTRPPPSEWRQYIARPQPPANVPNTKRRQAVQDVARPATTTPPLSPAAPPTARPVLSPPSPVPRAAEAPDPVEVARPPEPRTGDLPRRPETAPRSDPGLRALPAAPPATRTEPSRGASAPAAATDDRRRSPRAPQPSIQQPSIQQPSAPYPPPTVRTPPREAAAPAERLRPREAAPAPLLQPPPAPFPPRQRETAPPPAAPRSIDAPAPRGRGEGIAPHDDRRQAPRGPSAPSMSTPPAAAAPPRAAPSPATAPATAPAERDAGRRPAPQPAPSTRPDLDQPRGGDRARIGREATR